MPVKRKNARRRRSKRANTSVLMLSDFSTLRESFASMSRGYNALAWTALTLFALGLWLGVPALMSLFYLVGRGAL